MHMGNTLDKQKSKIDRCSIQNCAMWWTSNIRNQKHDKVDKKKEERKEKGGGKERQEGVRNVIKQIGHSTSI